MEPTREYFTLKITQVATKRQRARSRRPSRGVLREFGLDEGAAEVARVRSFDIAQADGAR